jgi:isocitrate dehydrogenase
MTLDRARKVKMVLETNGGETIVLKPEVKLDDGDVIDSMFMSKKALCDFYEEQMEDAYKTGVMFSLHVKATMMKVSHPIVFGHAVKVFYKDAFAKHQELFDELGVNVNNGLSDLYSKINRCRHFNVNRSSKTSTPATNTGWRWEQVRPRHRTSIHPVTSSWTPRAGDDPAGRQMYGADGRTKDTKAVNPGPPSPAFTRVIASVRRTASSIRDDGHRHNVGLMARQAKEYGSMTRRSRFPHGVANIVDVETGEVLLTQNVEAGDISACRRQGRADPRLGGNQPGPTRYAGGVLAGPGTSARERVARRSYIPRRSRHGGSRHRDHVSGTRHAASSARAAGRTPSPRPATSFATTSPT